MVHKIVQTLLVLTSVAYVCSNYNYIKKPTKIIHSEWKFKDYIKKFSPRTIWDRIDKRRKINGENITSVQEFDIMMEGIDDSDELLKLKVANINTRPNNNDTRRQFKPSGSTTNHTKDPFELRYRIYELMKGAIFQARDRMVVMQKLREKHKSGGLYKMGSLFSKTDLAVKIYAKFAYQSYKACSSARQESLFNHRLINIVQAEERLLNLWFDIDLLANLIVVNDRKLKKLLETVTENRKTAWKFIDRK